MHAHAHAHAQTHTDSDTINTATHARKRAGADARRRELDRLACTPARTGARTHACVHSHTLDSSHTKADGRSCHCAAGTDLM